MAISSALGVGSLSPGVCTSTTRPTNPFEGQMIYETDTNRVLIYDNSAWVMVVDTDTPPAMQILGSSNFTSVQQITFDGFTSEFRNYQIKMRVDSSSADCDLYLRYRTSSGTDSSGNYYTAVVGLGDGGGASNVTQLAATYHFIGSLDTGASAIGGLRSATIDVYNPFNSPRTEITYNSWGYTQGGTGTFYAGGGAFNTTASHVGFTMFTSDGSSTMTGSYQVYGFRS